MDARGRRADRVHAGAARALVVVWLCTSVHVAVAQPKPRSLWSGDLEKAVQLFGEALAADPGDADAATNLGQALARLGRRAEAERALREAIRLQPAREWAWGGLAELFADDPSRRGSPRTSKRCWRAPRSGWRAAKRRRPWVWPTA